MENTRLLPIRVTPEQEVAIQAFFQINGWTLVLEEIQTHCESCKSSLIDPDNEGQQEEQLIPNLELQAIPIVQVTVSDMENIAVTRRVMTISTQGAHKPYKCEHCGKGFRQQSHVKAHNKLHTGENLYRCETCGKYFMYRHNLISHASIHTGIRPFKCLQCGKAFRRKDDLQSHVRVHTGEKPFSCDVCGKSFSTQNQLPRHKRTHTGERPYKCKVCERGFRIDAHLKKHMRIHTGEKPYQCQSCGRKFSQLPHLQAHNRTHTGEKPYKCDECPKQFREKKSLTKHKVIHINGMPYECKICSKGFMRAQNLELHLSSHGSEEVGLAEALVSMRSAKIKNLLLQNGDIGVTEQTTNEDANEDTGVKESEGEHLGTNSEIPDEVDHKPMLSEELDDNQIENHPVLMQRKLNSKMIRTSSLVSTPDRNSASKIDGQAVNIIQTSTPGSLLPRQQLLQNIVIVNPQTTPPDRAGISTSKQNAHPASSTRIIESDSSSQTSSASMTYTQTAVTPVQEILQFQNAAEESVSFGTNQMVNVMTPQFQFSEENPEIQTIEISVPEGSHIPTDGHGQIQLVETSGHLANLADIALISDIVSQIIQQPDSLQSTEVIIPHASQLNMPVHVLQDEGASIIINEGAEDTIEILQNAHETLQ